MKQTRRIIIAAGALAVLLAVLLATRAIGPGGRPGAAPAAKVRLRAAFDAEFISRPDGYRGLCRHYGFAFSEEPRQMDPGLMYRAAADRAADVIDAFATDGRIAAYDLQVLVDDRRFFPPYQAAPLVRKAVLDQHPDLAGTLALLAGRITDAAMQQMNFRVDEKGERARDVARGFLVQEGVIAADAKPGSGQAGTITVGGKQFTEQEILGEIMAVLVECKTGFRVERRLNLGGTMICFGALQAGDLDLYAEYTGTGLVNILKAEATADPGKALQAVREEFAGRYGLVWLDPFGFNNTYTLTMRREQAEALEIRTITDLAEYLGRSGGP